MGNARPSGCFYRPLVNVRGGCFRRESLVPCRRPPRKPPPPLPARPPERPRPIVRSRPERLDFGSVCQPGVTAGCDHQLRPSSQGRWSTLTFLPEKRGRQEPTRTASGRPKGPNCFAEARHRQSEEETRRPPRLITPAGREAEHCPAT